MLRNQEKTKENGNFEFHNLSFGVQNYKMSYLLFMRSAMLWWWVATGFNLNPPMKLPFCSPVTTKNNLPLKIWCECFGHSILFVYCLLSIISIFYRPGSKKNLSNLLLLIGTVLAFSVFMDILGMRMLILVSYWLFG